ncbi:hypothetical protein D3C84_398210 [compost metagenome]
MRTYIVAWSNSRFRMLVSQAIQVKPAFQSVQRVFTQPRSEAAFWLVGQIGRGDRFPVDRRQAVNPSDALCIEVSKFMQKT